ncbi:MAG: TatD family hydrolase [Thermoflexaceae bacterium]|nr:TatD family hydrolase [Thermoflexaceae bacterium]
MIFESHAHYDDDKFDEDREELLSHLVENGIEYVVNIGSSIDSCKRTVKLMERYDYIYGALGIHPNEVHLVTDEEYEWLVREVKTNPKVRAIGEIGLDYYWEEPEPSVQKEWFEKQIELARQVKLPMVIHSRDAAKDTYDMMNALRCSEIGGVVHCFSYSAEEAKKYLDMGFYLGIGGVVTFKNGKKLKEVVEYAPLDRILLETDCPYLAPEPNRGRRNSSLNIPYIAKAIAGIKGVTYDEVVDITAQNAKKMYGIKA